MKETNLYDGILFGLLERITEVIDKDNPIFAEIADLMVWVLLNDDNGIVKHEAAFQIGLRNMKSKIPDLINSALNDKKELVRHEAIGFRFDASARM